MADAFTKPPDGRTKMHRGLRTIAMAVELSAVSVGERRCDRPRSRTRRSFSLSLPLSSRGGSNKELCRWLDGCWLVFERARLFGRRRDRKQC